MDLLYALKRLVGGGSNGRIPPSGEHEHEVDPDLVDARRRIQRLDARIEVMELGRVTARDRPKKRRRQQ